MNLETIKKSVDDEAAKTVMRERHGLAANTPIEIKTVPMELISDGTGHRFKARITTDTLDRDGEVMIPQGMDASEFSKTGAIFWNHNYDLPVAKPVGKMVRTKGFVDSEAEFATRPDDYQGEFFPDFARAMVNQGIVKGVSIGFIPVEVRSPSKKDVEEYGDDVRRVHSKFRLLEWSIAPVQCNPDAMIQQAISKGIISDSGELLPEVAKAEEAEPDDKPEMQTCSVCQKQYPVDDMTDDDGTYTCSACAAEKAAPEPEAAEPEAEKHIVREIEPANDENAIEVKRVHHILSGKTDEANTVKFVTRQIRKVRGAIYD